MAGGGGGDKDRRWWDHQKEGEIKETPGLGLLCAPRGHRTDTPVMAAKRRVGTLASCLRAAPTRHHDVTRGRQVPRKGDATVGLGGGGPGAGHRGRRCPRPSAPSGPSPRAAEAGAPVRGLPAAPRLPRPGHARAKSRRGPCPACPSTRAARRELGARQPREPARGAPGGPDPGTRPQLTSEPKWHGPLARGTRDSGGRGEGPRGWGGAGGVAPCLPSPFLGTFLKFNH